MTLCVSYVIHLSIQLALRRSMYSYLLVAPVQFVMRYTYISSLFPHHWLYTGINHVPWDNTAQFQAGTSVGKHVDGAEVVSVLILLWLFVIHVLSKFPDTGSVNVNKIRMVDSVLQGNVFQVGLFFPLPVHQELVGVGKDHPFGQRLTIICSFCEAEKKNGIILPIFFLS
jgi:hypothetical protein